MALIKRGGARRGAARFANKVAYVRSIGSERGAFFICQGQQLDLSLYRSRNNGAIITRVSGVRPAIGRARVGWLRRDLPARGRIESENKRITLAYLYIKGFGGRAGEC